MTSNGEGKPGDTALAGSPVARALAHVPQYPAISDKARDKASGHSHCYSTRGLPWCHEMLCPPVVAHADIGPLTLTLSPTKRGGEGTTRTVNELRTTEGPSIRLFKIRFGGVRAAVDFLQSLDADVGGDLRGIQAGMAQKLHAPHGYRVWAQCCHGVHAATIGFIPMGR